MAATRLALCAARAPRRAIVVGDVHGCLRELKTLLARCEHDPQSDRVVFVGDLVGKGPDSCGVVAFARRIGALGVRGNHDHSVLELRSALDAGRKPARLPSDDHQRVARMMPPADVEYLSSLPLTLAIGDTESPSSRGWTVVHAGVPPDAAETPERGDPELLMNMREIKCDGLPTAKSGVGAPWASLWRGPTHAVFGHDARRGLQLEDHATGLDTGCV